MRADIAAEINIFRDAYFRYDVLVSKELAGKIIQLASREMSFRDVTTHRTIDLPVSGGRRRLKARLKPAAIPTDDEALPLHRRLDIRVLPLLGRCAGHRQSPAVAASGVAAHQASKMPTLGNSARSL